MRYLLLISVFLFYGCSLSMPLSSKFRKVTLIPIDINASKPSIINILFRVEDDKGNPVPNIAEPNFAIFEDGLRLNDVAVFKRLKKEEEKPLLNKTIIAIDMGNGVSYKKRKIIVQTLEKLIQDGTIKINPRNLLMVVTFNENIYLISNWTSDRNKVLNSLSKIYKSRNGVAVNLYGAVAKLSTLFGKRQTRFEVRSIILITENGDNASTIPLQQTLKFLKNTHVYMVVIGSSSTNRALEKLGKNGFFPIKNYSEFLNAVSGVFHKVNNFRDSIYLLEYVSPKRKSITGDSIHTVTIKLLGKGGAELKAKFDSSQFEPVKSYIEITKMKKVKDHQIFLKAKSKWVNAPSKFVWQILDPEVATLTINTKNSSEAILSYRKDVIGKTELVVKDITNGLETTYPVLIGIYRDTIFNFEDGKIPEAFEIEGIGWKVVNENGNRTLKTLHVGDNQETSIKWRGYFEGNRISFDYRVSSEEGCDEMLFFIDGKGFYQSGETGWRRVEYPISNGEHTFEWKYRKDGSRSKYQDSVWLDNIRIYSK
ncbi:MAG TPA: VWA domain-containing protein [Campylobacterales bacterium]|nr:VWA domain-containing protein [Campylobacterales bacterium]